MKTAARRMEDDYCKIYPHIALSQLHIAEGDAAAGLQSAKRALNLAERVTARLEIGAAHRALGQAYEAKGDRQSADELFRGTLTQTSVFPREIVKQALQHNAAAVILAHNHPSGVAEPSRADEALTQTLKDTLALVDIKVLDHFVVGAASAMSFAERGLL